MGEEFPFPLPDGLTAGKKIEAPRREEVVRGDVSEVEYLQGVTSDKVRMRFFSRVVVEAGEVLEVEMPRGIWTEVVTLKREGP